MWAFYKKDIYLTEQGISPQHLLKHMPPAEILSSMTILNHGPNNVE